MNQTGRNWPGDRERVLLEEAYVLHRRPYRETSALVDILSARHGRLPLLAKGLRRGKSADPLQPFRLLRVSWTGNVEFPLYTGAESIGAAPILVGAALYCALYLNELLLHLLPPGDPCPKVFRLYRDSLARLEPEAGRENTLRRFELGLLEEIGYGLDLYAEIDPARRYLYVIEQGLAEAKLDHTDSISGATLLNLRRGALEDAGELREAKHLMRRLLNHYLGGRPLKSRTLFQTVPPAPSPSTASSP